jgi:hypothetical protein
MRAVRPSEKRLSGTTTVDEAKEGIVPSIRRVFVKRLRANACLCIRPVLNAASNTAEAGSGKNPL